VDGSSLHRDQYKPEMEVGGYSSAFMEADELAIPSISERFIPY
jgi:hypothetical protein